MTGFFYTGPIVAVRSYQKPHLPYADQLKLLTSRGLSVSHIPQAVDFLKKVSYYRLSAYGVPFKGCDGRFVSGVSFERLVRLYNLDEELRLAVLSALSPVEVYFRTRLTYQLTERHGPFAHYQKILFRSTFNYTQWLDSLESEIGRAHEQFIEHFKATYAGFPKLPLWMAVEVMSFGSLSKLYGGLLPDPQRSICLPFGVHHSVMHNWLHALTYLRNLCAHHNRLWNRELAIRPDIPRKNHEWRVIVFDNTRIFAVVAVVEWLIRSAGLPIEGADKIYKILSVIAEEGKGFDKLMGIPDGVRPGFLWTFNE